MNYLLIGPEEYTKCHFIERIKKSSLSAKEGSFDFEIFHAGDAPLSDILDSFNILPFASKQRIVIIKDIENLSHKEKTLILKYLKSPAHSTELVLETSLWESDKFIAEASRLAKLVRFPRLKAPQLNSWIKKEFASHGKKISQACVDLIIDGTGGDLFTLKNEIEKVASFVKNKKEIAEEDIESVSGKNAYKTAFELVDMVLEKAADKALLYIDRLLVKEKPHQILNLLAWQYRKKAKEKTFLNKGRLDRKLEIILEADLAIKRGMLDARLALECTLVSLCNKP